MLIANIVFAIDIFVPNPTNNVAITEAGFNLKAQSININANKLRNTYYGLKQDAEGYYKITTLEELLCINPALYITTFATSNASNIEKASEVLSAKYRLYTDIDISHLYWVPIGYANYTTVENKVTTMAGYDSAHKEYEIMAFCGEFDGNGHSIIGMNIANKEGCENIADPQILKDYFNIKWFNCYAGFFARVTDGAIVKNVRFEQPKINITIKSTDKERTINAGIIASAIGDREYDSPNHTTAQTLQKTNITNCSILNPEIVVTITNESVGGNVFCGGIVGSVYYVNHSTEYEISNCSIQNGKIRATSINNNRSSTNRTRVCLGGVLGNACTDQLYSIVKGIIKNCCIQTEIYSYIKQSSLDYVNYQNLGGIVGRNVCSSSEISNCFVWFAVSSEYWYIDEKGESYNGTIFQPILACLEVKNNKGSATITNCKYYCTIFGVQGDTASGNAGFKNKATTGVQGQGGTEQQTDVSWVYTQDFVDWING